MNISIFGLGYVGTVSAGCFALDGHNVIGVDPIKTKVDLISEGRSSIIEAEISEIIAHTIQSGRLHATTDPIEAIRRTEISFICVGTPSQDNGDLDLRYITRVCQQIGEALQKENTRHLIVVRSTVLPGTTRNIVIPILEASALKKAGSGFDVCHNPEFLREGSAVRDFKCPAKTVLGELEQGSGDKLAELYANLDAPLLRTDLETAEIVKYVDNCWHALKITFANEIGNFCEAFSVDAQRVMEIFCGDRKLNLSSAYLRPGFAFGGSCLPKDLRALAYQAKMHDLELPVITSILPSNAMQIARGLRIIQERGHKRVGILGLSFKAGTDDLRESPIIEIIERLIGKGYDLRIFDKNVNVASLIGANREYILNHIPHISRLMVERIETVLSHAETVVIGNDDQDFRTVRERLRSDQVLVDLARVSDRSRP